MGRSGLNSKNNSKNIWIACLAVFLFFVIQHYIRRFGQPIPNIFLTVINKAIAFTSFTMISASILIALFAKIWAEKWKNKLHYIKSFGILGFILSFVHILISIMMFSSVYYPDYFTSDNKMTVTFGISLLLGIFAFVYFVVISFNLLFDNMQKFEIIKKINYTVYIFLLGHIFILKYNELFDKNSWVNGLPSGHFVGFLITIVVIIFYVIARLKSKEA